VNHPVLLEVLSNLDGKELNNPRIPIMIKGYFEDMNLVLKELYKVCQPGAKIALVVGNVRFEGELIPVDLLLSDLASDAGFQINKVIITRYKGNSSQQMGKYGRVPVRESILIWSKG
jgi:site-specific DNA-methyltransferase (cytosine-N4-specific)